MPAAGSVRYVFPGGNTAFGFYSFYDDIIKNAFKRLFILKGGPGVGKSTLIKNIGSQLLQQGYDIEYHCCSSDKNSFDGLLAPSLGIAIVDGTAPHTIDPQHPGAVDEIVNLGNFWHEKGLIELKDEITALSRQIKHLFARAYNYLAQAKLLQEDLESYYQVSNCLDIPALNWTGHRLIEDIFPRETPRRLPKVRHLFASAITPQGLTNHLSNLFDNLGKRYIITGPPGTGKATILHKLYETATSLGYQVEAYHCALIPTKIEHLILPELDTGIITSTGPHTYQPQPQDEVINLDELLDKSLLTAYSDDLAAAKQRFDAALQKALEFMGRVKEYRDRLESYYIANMDFPAINDFVVQLNARIQALIKN
ncbi:MAG TPA: hypothetical protein GX504_00090 [Clostridia bacterium]|nr:hypothetical protein [Clostridia bacterium]